jgi:hypothetical protein
LNARKADKDSLIETSKGKRKFIPLGFEALGGFSSNSKKFIDFIAMEWSSKSGIDKAAVQGNNHFQNFNGYSAGQWNLFIHYIISLSHQRY